MQLSSHFRRFSPFIFQITEGMSLKQFQSIAINPYNYWWRICFLEVYLFIADVVFLFCFVFILFFFFFFVMVVLVGFKFFIMIIFNVLLYYSIYRIIKSHKYLQTSNKCSSSPFTSLNQNLNALFR